MRFTIRRLYNEVYKTTGNKQNALVYGAGDGGTMVSRTLNQDPSSRYKIIAFVDDDPKRVGSQINTIKVLSPNTALNNDFITKNAIEVMIIAIPSISETRSKEIIEEALSFNLNALLFCILSFIF